MTSEQLVKRCHKQLRDEFGLHQDVAWQACRAVILFRIGGDVALCMKDMEKALYKAGYLVRKKRKAKP
jgi:hypothetical protein